VVPLTLDDGSGDDEVMVSNARFREVLYSAIEGGELTSAVTEWTIPFDKIGEKLWIVVVLNGAASLKLLPGLALIRGLSNEFIGVCFFKTQLFYYNQQEHSKKKK
jgi:hypothetical protein